MSRHLQNTLICWLLDLNSRSDQSHLSPYTDAEADRYLEEIRRFLEQDPTTFNTIERLHTSIDEVSIEHLKQVRAYYRECWTPREQISYLLHDQELLNHWEADRLSLSSYDDPSLTTYVEQLLTLQKKKRKISMQLVETLNKIDFQKQNGEVTNGTRETEQSLRTSLKQCHLNINEVAEQLIKPLYPRLGAIYMRQGVAINYGLPRLMFGEDESEKARIQTWRAQLPDRRVAKLRKSYSRNQRFNGCLKTRDMIDLQYCEDPYPPMFSSESRTADNPSEIESPLSLLYTRIHENWKQKHQDFEDRTYEGKPIKLSRFRYFRKFNVKMPPLFKTSRNIVRELVCGQLLQTKGFEHLLATVDWKALLKEASMQDADSDVLET